MKNQNSEIDITVEVIGIDDLPRLANDLASDVWLPACDTETEFRKELEDDGIPGAVRVISFAVRRADGSEAAYVVDLRDTPAEQVAAVMAEHEFLGFNANFDEHGLLLAGIQTAGWYDVMLADCVTRSGRSGVVWYRSLAQLTKLALDIDLDGKGDVQLSYNMTDDLTADQIRYAGFDAVVTRRVADWVRANVEAANLVETVELENGSREFINAMQIHGVPFDLDGYLEVEIAAKREIIADCLHKLADLTESKPLEEAPQLVLFEHAVEAHSGEGDARPVPAWNPNSKPDLIRVLNTYATDAVKAYTARVYGEERLLMASDPLQKSDLSQIKSPIVTTLLKLKKAAKDTTTYGADLRKHHRNGRFHSRYKQGGIVSTGRLASFAFNAQNLSKSMLPYMRPQTPGKVLVAADVSQAELRFMAHLSSDTGMIEAFSSDEDFHTKTVRDMHPDVDIDEIAERDPALMKNMRTQAKSVAFGLAYGMGASLLAKNLTVAGVETSPEEAQGYLDSYFAARPQVKAWLEARDQYVKDFAQALPAMDWQASFRLYALREETEVKRRSLKKKLGRMPSFVELAAHVWPDGPATADPNDDGMSDDELLVFWNSQAASLEWAYRYEGAVLLTATGDPWEMYSYTAAGRRRCFNVALGNERSDKFSGFVTAVLLEMAGTRKPAGKAFIQGFAAAHDLELPSDAMWRNERNKARVETLKAFEGSKGKALKLELIREAIKQFGWQALEPMFRKCASGCMRAMRNAYRNHPVQGSVADVVEYAFAEIIKGLPDGAVPLISVHDSVVVEVWEQDAEDVARLIHDSINDGMARYCSSCPSKVDADIRTSLSDEDVIWEYNPQASTL